MCLRSLLPPRLNAYMDKWPFHTRKQKEVIIITLCAWSGIFHPICDQRAVKPIFLFYFFYLDLLDLNQQTHSTKEKRGSDNKIEYWYCDHKKIMLSISSCTGESISSLTQDSRALTVAWSSFLIYNNLIPLGLFTSGIPMPVFHWII